MNNKRKYIKRMIGAAAVAAVMAVSGNGVAMAQTSPFKVSTGEAKFLYGSNILSMNPTQTQLTNGGSGDGLTVTASQAKFYYGGKNTIISSGISTSGSISASGGLSCGGLTMASGASNCSYKIHTNLAIGASNPAFFILSEGMKWMYFALNQDGIVMSSKVGVVTAIPQYALHVTGDIAYTGASIALSDARLKTNIKDLGATRSQFGKLRPVTYNLKPHDVSKYYKNVPDSITIKNDDDLYRYLGLEKIDERRNRIGFLAQEVREVYPELVYEDSEGMLAVDYVSLIPVLVGVVQEQNETIQSLARRLEALERNTGGTVQSVAGVNNFTFSLFPNPTSGFVTVDYTMFVDASICIELYNTFGQRVKLITPQQNQKAGTYSIQTSIGDLGAGAFIVKATSGGQVESKQLMIN